MALARQTFIIRVHEPDRGAVLEHVGSRQCIAVADLASVGARIAEWLQRERATAGGGGERPGATDPRPSADGGRS